MSVPLSSSSFCVNCQFHIICMSYLSQLLLPSETVHITHSLTDSHMHAWTCTRFHVNQWFLLFCQLRSAYTRETKISNLSDITAVILLDQFSKNKILKNIKNWTTKKRSSIHTHTNTHTHTQTNACVSQAVDLNSLITFRYHPHLTSKQPHPPPFPVTQAKTTQATEAPHTVRPTALYSAATGSDTGWPWHAWYNP